jgi:hypothetical protein
MSRYIFYFETAALIASLFAWPYLRKKNYFRIFPVILVLVVAIEAYVTLSWSFNTFIYNVQVPLQHLLYLLLIYLSLEDKKYRIIVVTFIAICLVVFPLSVLYLTEKNHINTVGYCTGCTFIIIGILLKLYEVLQAPLDLNFLSEPIFYLLFFYFLFCVSTLPYFAMGNWLYYTMKRGDILGIFVNAMTIYNYVLYTAYTIIFIWMTRQSSLS